MNVYSYFRADVLPKCPMWRFWAARLLGDKQVNITGNVTSTSYKWRGDTYITSVVVRDDSGTRKIR